MGVKSVVEFKLGQEIVVLDTDALKFNESNLGQFIEEAPTWYAYFGRVLADCEAVASAQEHKYECAYAEAYKQFKIQNGYTDKMCEASAKTDPEVDKAFIEWIQAKQHMGWVKNHLKAWDHAHQNARERGYTLRKELDKLSGTRIYELTDKVDEIIKGSD